MVLKCKVQMLYSLPAPVLRNSLPSDQRRVAHHVDPSLIFNSPGSDLSTSLSLFLKKLKPIFFTVLLLLSLYSPRLSLD